MSNKAGPAVAEPPAIAAALPIPALLVGPALDILFANPAAEQFFALSAAALTRHKLCDLAPFGSPLLSLVAQARERTASVSERNLDLSMPRHGSRLADATATPAAEAEGVVLLTLHERGIAHRMDRQQQHRDAVRSMHDMAAVLAHEIKNPLAGIRGAAQLLEDAVPATERNLIQLICDESDRIRNLIDRMEMLGAMKPPARTAVNIHEVLDRVRSVAQASFARHIRFQELFDPSLPGVLGDRDQLIQVFMNLVRNAADASPGIGGEIVLTTAYRPGVRVSAANGGERLGLPLEVTVRDNGSGIAAGLLPHIFDPFVTTKPRGSGLGLALVAKIVDDHGGVIECESASGRTLFRVLLPLAKAQ